MATESQATSHSKGKGKGYFSWTADMDQIMETCFSDQMNQGNKLDGRCAWKQTAYTAIINALHEQLKISVTKAHIQLRFKTWEKHYDILHPLLQSCNSGSAITWDYSRGRIEVHDEDVWQQRLEANPKLGPYRRKILVENWDDICVPFSQDRAAGKGAQIAVEANVEIEAKEESTNFVESLETNPQSLEKENEVMNNLLAQQRSKSKASSSANTHGTKRKLTSSQALYKVLERMADSLDKYLNSESPKATSQSMLDELGEVDLDERQLLKGVDLLMNNERKFVTFSGLPNELKRQWILMHIGE